MAYRDMNGNITIDEVAAGSDIQKMVQAIQILKDGESALKTVIIDSDGYQGETAAAIIEKAVELQSLLLKMVQNLETTQSYTRQVVERYKKIDMELKAAIEAGSVL